MPEGPVATSSAEVYPGVLKDREYWVCWVLDGVGRKRPVSPWDTGTAYPSKWRSTLDDDERPETDFEAARRWAGHRTADLAAPDDLESDELGLGLILPTDRPAPDRRVVLIDWDDVRDPDTGAIHPIAAAYLKAGETYAEISQSGEGIHQFIIGELPNRGKLIKAIDDEPWVGDDLPQVEIYDGGRHVAMTGQHVDGTPQDVARNQSLVDDLLEEFADDRDTDGDGVAFGDYDLDPTDDRPVCYNATLQAREDPPDHLANWELIGYVTMLGAGVGYDNSEILEDLRAHPAPPYGFDPNREPDEVRRLGRQVRDGERSPPSAETLAGLGILPDPGACDCPLHEHETAGSDDDPRDLDVAIHPQRAWDAAGLVTVDDLDGSDADTLSLDTTGGKWACPECGDAVAVVRAAAIATGRVDTCADPLADEYHAAYRDARERFGAPLPRYLTNADTTARYDVIVGAIHELTFWDLDRDALTADVTAEDAETSTSDAALELDPTPVYDEHGSWRESESGTSVVVYDDGSIRDYGHPDAGDRGVPVDPLRLVALERGLIDDPTDPVGGDVFRAAITAARADYGAPLPRWENGTPDGHTPLLPPAEDLTGDSVADDELQRTRDDVETLHRDAATGGETPVVVTSLPATGKTTAAIKTAAEGVPTTYLAPRKSLMQQAREKADEWGATWCALPVFGGKIDDEVLAEGVEHVRESGRDALRNRWQVLGAATDGGELPGEDDEDDDEPDPRGAPDPGDEFAAVRPTCPTAEGEHGDDWKLAVHVARRLDFTPRDIHERAEGLFGDALPCQHGDECPYSEGWDAVRDPEGPPDLLIGHYAHFHVESARTQYRLTADGRLDRGERAVVIDEFPGFDTYADHFGHEAARHAVWLASALRDDVADTRDLFERDLWGDPFVRAWLNGETDTLDDVAPLVNALQHRETLLEAADEAEYLLTAAGDAADAHGLTDALRDLAKDTAGVSVGEWCGRTRDALRDAKDNTGGHNWVLDAVENEILQPLAEAPAAVDTPESIIDELPIGNELRRLVTEALDATADYDPEDRARLGAARDALLGGDAGARELAVWATDGWAHRDAHYLLRGIITPTGDDAPADRLQTRHGGHVDTDGWGSRDDGASINRVQYDGVTVLVDRDGEGATIHNPPDRTAGSGSPAPVVGLDATGRRHLWELALGETVETRDVHTSPRERQQFLREQLGLRVVQIGDEARPYEGNPDGKDLDGDVALLRRINDRYTGIHAPRTPGDEPRVTGSPAAVTTKDVRDKLEADSRLRGTVAEWENYGNLTGENDLDKHTLAALLGTTHYGHHTVDFVAALAGEEPQPAGRGIALDYGAATANAYLKHMREDQVMQAVLRFARGGSGALVFTRTSALRGDLPVVGRGDVARTWSDTATAVAAYAARHPDETVTVAALEQLDEIDVGRRHLRRILSELDTAGYLTRVVDHDGVAGEYTTTGDAPDTHAVGGLPETPAPGAGESPGDSSQEVSYTANVRVYTPDSPPRTGDGPPLARLPPPAEADRGGPGHAPG